MDLIINFLVNFLIDGALGLSWWKLILVTLVFTHITIASVTIYLHRCQAHRALKLHWLPSHFFRGWLWLTTGMVTKEWVAIHRKHHAKCETPEDPHSPHTHGIRTVFFEGSELYRSEAKNEETLSRFGLGTPNDWIERNLYTKHSWKGVAVMLIADVLLFGVIGVTIWAIQMLWIPVTAAGVINGIGHWWGYRNADVDDGSTNVAPWGILIGGEELHNNHHTYPTSAKLSIKPYEFDIGWAYIRVLEILRLAKVHRSVPKTKRSKCTIDPKTLEFIRTDRGYISRSLRKRLLWVIKKELQHAGEEEREHLLSLREILSTVTWKEVRDTKENKTSVFDKCREHFRALEGTKSKLPKLGKFADLLTAIQTMKDKDHEPALISELDKWVKDALLLQLPRIRRFTNMLTRSYIAR